VDLTAAYDLTDFADVVFIIEGTYKFTAHKVILCAKSDYFSRMFRSGLLESTNIDIPMADVSEKAFSLLLRALYTTNYDLPTAVIEDGQLLIELLQYSSLYGISNIKHAVETALSAAIHSDCAVSLLLYAELYEATILSNECKYFIAKNYLEISKTPEFSQLSAELKKEIIKKM